MWLYALGNNRPSANDAIMANRYPLEYDSSTAKPDAITDRDRSIHRQLRIHRMLISIHYQYIRSYLTVPTDYHGYGCHDLDVAGPG